ncbi:protein nervous wreck-like isoform X8 [Daphnia pulicaria]|uniref:protein nervous wreck-like isoform X7 n=1 Tax=Daphnia pulicaria TaxID=35523 RepID=UPI001EE9DD56|nr:protein nervous wreck-like isoform X7 [Daphnia pulicaria]XP_046649035.1 protein nervous wreck-like isoform X8 [Daphnia pulicaria]
MKESGLKSDPNEPNGPNIDAKIDEIKNQLRRTETAKIKAEARLECLHADGGRKLEWQASPLARVSILEIGVRKVRLVLDVLKLSKVSDG